MSSSTEPIATTAAVVADAVAAVTEPICTDADECTSSRLDGVWQAQHPRFKWQRRIVVKNGKFQTFSGDWTTITSSGKEDIIDWGESNVQQVITVDTESPEFGKKDFEFTWELRGSGVAKETQKGDYFKWIRLAPLPNCRGDYEVKKKTEGVDGVWRVFGPKGDGNGMRVEIKNGKYWSKAEEKDAEVKVFQALPDGDNQWMVKRPDSDVPLRATVHLDDGLQYIGATIEWTCDDESYPSEKWVRDAEGPAPVMGRDFMAGSDQDLTGYWEVYNNGEVVNAFAVKEWTFFRNQEFVTLGVEIDANKKPTGNMRWQTEHDWWRTFPTSVCNHKDFLKEGFQFDWNTHGTDADRKVSWKRISDFDFLYRQAVGLASDHSFNKLYYRMVYGKGPRKGQSAPSHMSSYLFGCMATPLNSMVDWTVCYPCMYAKTYSYASEGPDGGFDLFCCLVGMLAQPVPPLYLCQAFLLRSAFYQNYHPHNMDAGCIACCCPSCSNCQIWRELETKKTGTGKSVSPGGCMIPGIYIDMF